MGDSIYLDNQATTPTDPRVRDALLPFLETSAVGNPHSEHFAGRLAAEAVEDARAKVAALIGARPHEIVFTSGATEANNIALQGVSRSFHRRGNHIITCATEHKCVLETVDFLARSGFQVSVLPVDSNGVIDTAVLAAAITDKTSRRHRENQEARAGPDVAHRCLVHGAPPRCRRRHRNRDRLPHLPRHGDHGLPNEWRPHRGCAAHGRTLERENDGPLRPAQR